MLLIIHSFVFINGFFCNQVLLLYNERSTHGCWTFIFLQEEKDFLSVWAKIFSGIVTFVLLSGYTFLAANKFKKFLL